MDLPRDLEKPAVATSPSPMNEEARLAALRRFEILDTPPEAAFDQITRLAAKLLGVPIALISLIDEKRQWFKSRVGLEATETPRADAFCHHALTSDKVLVVPDASIDERFATNPLVTGDPNIRFYAGAPLRTPDGLALGTLCVIDRKARTLSVQDQETLRALSEMVMAQIESRREIAFTYPLTGLANRFRFIRDIEGFLGESKDAFTLDVLKIDCISAQQFEELGRTLGHAVTDAFEIVAARRVAGQLPPRTRLYHLSSARFGCVLSHVDEDLLGRLSATLQQPLICDGVPVLGSCAMGIAQYPKDGKTAQDLLRAADSAIDQARTQQVPWANYTVAWDQAAQRAFRLLKDLGAAVSQDDQLHVLYQPKIDLATDRCIGSEALLRWQHPELGLVPPGEFIPLAERTMLIRSVTRWVLQAVFAQAARWQKDGLNLKTSINVSMLDLDDDNFGNKVSALLIQEGVSPSAIDFEVTESALMKDSARVARQLQHVRALGIDIEIDDFGTGQSALSYLKHIPGSIVKIDQMFIRSLADDRGDQCMVRSTIDLAHELGFKVVAEGIESTETQEWLAQHNCDFGQGYAISKPLPVQAFEAWLFADGHYTAEPPSSGESSGSVAKVQR